MGLFTVMLAPDSTMPPTPDNTAAEIKRKAPGTSASTTFLSCVLISQPVNFALSLTGDLNGNRNRLFYIRSHSDPAPSAHFVDHARGPASRD
jgi:hypothetical protein